MRRSSIAEFASLRKSPTILACVTLESRPIGRRLLLALGAVPLLGACAAPAKTTAAGHGSSGAPASPPEPAQSTSAAPSFTAPTPAKPTPGVCPTVPGIVQKPGGPQHYLPCSGTDIALTIDDGPDP